MSGNVPRTRREIIGVTTLSLGFGLVGIDRFLISTMYPTIAADLDLDYADIGTITGALALAWGIAALLMGNLADRIGHRRVLVGSLVVFSVLIGASGLAHSLAGLILVRLIMGLADGAFTPASIAATVRLSPEERHGSNVGLQQTMLVLFGLGLSPLLVGYLLRLGVDWRYIFSVFVLPGLVLAWVTASVIPAHVPAARASSSTFADWRAVVRYRNIPLLMLGMLCWLTCLIITSAFLPSYFVNHLRLTTPQMGFVMSAIGFGAMTGTVVLSTVSDRVGRKPVMILSSIGALLSLAVLASLGPQLPALFIALFAIHFFNNALITLTVGPIAIETVPVALMTTASGMVIAAGELIGGGLAPIAGGLLAQQLGIEHTLMLPLAMMAIGIVLCCALRETHPALKRRNPHNHYRTR